MNPLEAEDLNLRLDELRARADAHVRERDRLEHEAKVLSEERSNLSSKASRLESEAKHAERLSSDDAISAREACLMKEQWQAKLDLMVSRGGLGDIDGTKYQIRHYKQIQERLEKSVRSSQASIAKKRQQAEELRKKAAEAGSRSMSARKRAQSEHDSYISVKRRIQQLTDVNQN